MPKRNFFKQKNEWSKIKDELLESYLRLYFSKILITRQPAHYIDCFAGKGFFDDGSIGSPIIALNESEESIKNSTNQFAKISCHFIESEYGNELIGNIKDRNAIIYSGKYEEQIEEILKTCIGNNVFLYVDPYGIKSLHFDKFNLLKKYKFNSTELFLNLNSFGFFREGCRLLGCSDLLEDDGELEERENAGVNKSVNTIDNMNRVANGDYWKQIVYDYKNDLISSHEAEERFVNEYCKNLSEIFKYVINIPIKAKKIKNMPKYRMVFCTNHKHGIIEMSQNMYKRWKKMQIDERNGQSVFFEFDVNFNGEMIHQDIKTLIMPLMQKKYIQYDDFLCEFIKQNGILQDISHVTKCMKQMENDGVVEILRKPALTPKGKPTTWMDYKKNMKVRLNS